MNGKSDRHRFRTAPFLAKLLALALASAATAQETPTAAPSSPTAPEAKARTVPATDKEIWAGQKITLRVDLMVPGYFTGVPILDLPRVPGLLLLPPAGSPPVGSEEADGVSYTVQQHELMVIPFEAGPVTIPPFEIRLAYKRQPLDKDSVAGVVRTSAVTFTVKPVPGLPDGVRPLTSRGLTVTESWKPELPAGRQVRTGSAFVRTIQWTAPDVPGMAFPPMELEKISGLGIYTATPEVNDTARRGELTGSRRDTVTYVCRTGGQFVIPPLTLKWWDPDARELKEVTFPLRTLDVAAPPVPPISFTARVHGWIRSHWQAAAMLGTAALLALTALRFAQKPIRTFLAKLKPRHLAPLNPESPNSRKPA